MKNANIGNYHFMATLALMTGLLGLALQFLPGWELLSFMLSVAVLGGLVGGRDSYEARERQQLEQSYKRVYE